MGWTGQQNKWKGEHIQGGRGYYLFIQWAKRWEVSGWNWYSFFLEGFDARFVACEEVVSRWVR